MRQFLLILSLLNFYVTSTAQTSFSWSPNDSIVEDISSNDYTYLKIDMVNESPGELQLGMEVMYNNIPSTWDGMICVNSQCFGTILPVGDNRELGAVSGDANAWVRLTVNPMGGTGTYELRVRIYNVQDPTDEAMAVWIVNAEPTLGHTEYEITKELTVLSNPITNGTLELSSSDETIDMINVTNLKGQVVYTTNVQSLSYGTFDLSHLTSGLYIVHSFSEGKRKDFKKIIINE